MNDVNSTKKQSSIPTVGCENDDRFFWFHFIDSCFIYEYFEDKLRLQNMRKGRAGCTCFRIDKSVFCELSKLEEDMSKI